jgi:kumamolisin
MANYIVLPGSDRPAQVGLAQAGDLDLTQRVAVTVVLRRKRPLPDELVHGERSITRVELQEVYGADQADADLVRDTMEGAGLTVEEVDLGMRRVRISGELATMSATFGAELSLVRRPNLWGPGDTEHRYRTGSLRMPQELAGPVDGVLGLDDRPQARAHLRLAEAAAGGGYQPPQLGEAYAFPPSTDGTGQTLAILELGGGYRDADLQKYFADLSIPMPAVRAVGVDGGKNAPTGDPNSADGEVLLDIEVAGALAPKAGIVVYFAPNTDQGFVDALTTAVHADPTPTAVSISWGGSEDSWTDQARAAFDKALADAAALGVSVFASAGDNGSGDGAKDGKPHVDFPASSPNIVGCGGTNLQLAADGTVASEKVWHSTDGGATGGGVSVKFPLPDYQAKVGVPPRPGGGEGRGVPDLAANADPSSGYQVLVDGKQMVVGGTSAVSPLMAALCCRLAQALGAKIGPLQRKIYGGVGAGAVAPGFRDITEGSNGAYAAGVGWDACTGLGVPVGTDLLAVLKKPA